MPKFIPIGIFLSIFLLGAMLSPHIGPSWDEPDNIYAGGVYLKFFEQRMDPKVFEKSWDVNDSSFGDRIYTQQTSMERYPPFPLILGAGVTWILEHLHVATAFEIIGYYHVASALFLGLLGVSVYFLGKKMGLSTLFAVFSGFSCVFLPTVFGHGLSTIKDVGQISLFTASLTALISFSETKKWRFVFLGGILWGLGLATKFNVIYVPIIWGMFLILSYVIHKITRSKGKIHYSFMEVFVALALLAVLGFVVLLLSWPYLWFQTVPRIQAVIGYFTTVGTGYKVVFNGKDAYVGDITPVWWYPIGYLLLTTPLPFLFSFFIGVGTIVWHFFSKKREGLLGLFLLIWFCVPLGRAFLPHSAYYDGIRHFMEIFPPMTIIAFLGLTAIGKKIAARLPLVKHARLEPIVGLIIPFVILGHLLFIDATLFPYSSGYLNILASDQNYRYDRDFSGLAVKEGMEYIESMYPNGMSIFVPVAGHLSWYYVNPKADRYVYSIYDADTIVLINKSSHVRKADLDALLGTAFKVVHTISRGSSIFGWVYKRVT